MTLPFTLPDWVPWWVPLVLIVPALLYALAFLFMPFSVLGVKTRLEAIELRLDEIQQELRSLSARLPGARQELDFEDVYAPPFPSQPRRTPSLGGRPPVTPLAEDLSDNDTFERPPPPPEARPQRRQDPQTLRPPRSEPRIGPLR